MATIGYPHRTPYEIRMDTIDYTPAGPVPMRGVRVHPDLPPWDVDFGGDEPDYSRPEIIDKPPSKLKRIAGTIAKYGQKYALPIAQGGIAAASTPNVAGGGPVDIMRAAQVGMGIGQARRDREQARIEQQRKQEIEWRKTESEIGENQAQEEYWRKKAQEPGFMERFKEGIAMGMSVQQALIYGSGGTLQDKGPGEKKHEDEWIEVDEATAKKYGTVRKNPKTGNYEIPISRLTREPPPRIQAPARPAPLTPAQKLATEQAEWQRLADLYYPRGTPENKWYAMYGPSRPYKPPKIPTPKGQQPATRAQFAAADARMARAKQKAIDDFHKNMDSGGMIGLTEEKKQEFRDRLTQELKFVQEMYDQEIRSLTGGEYNPPAQGAGTPPPTQQPYTPQGPQQPVQTPQPPPAPTPQPTQPLNPKPPDVGPPTGPTDYLKKKGLGR